MKNLSKTEAKEVIDKFFKTIKSKNSKEIKKIKTLAMKYNIKLGAKKKKFCKKCYSPELKIISVKNKIKKVLCEGCGEVSKYKIKIS